MSKSDPPLIISSGTKFSVSVSEHTGNAQRPQNHVKSGQDTNKTQSESVKEQKLTDKPVAVVDGKDIDQNLQFIDPELAPNAPSATESFINSAGNDHQILLEKAEPIDALPAESINLENKSIDPSVITENISPQAGAQQPADIFESADNIQKISASFSQENIQAIPQSDESNNQQRFSTDANLPSENIPITEVKASAERNLLPSSAAEANHQTLPVTDIDTHKIPITSEDFSNNFQKNPGQSSNTRKQPLATPISAKNDAPNIPNGLAAAHQPLIDKESIQDHFERLPSDDHERDSSGVFNAGSADNTANVGNDSVTGSWDIYAKSNPDPAPTFNKPVSTDKRQGHAGGPASMVRPATQSTVSAQSAAQKREESKQAFVGRVARLKRDFASINTQLDRLTEKK